MDRNRLIVHPVRSRIVGSLMGRNLTTRQIAALMPDVPMPSLYRLLRQLVEGEVIEVVGETPKRGAKELTYALRPEGGRIDRRTAGPETRQAILDNLLQMSSAAYRTYNQAGGTQHSRAGMTAVYLDEAQAEELFRRTWDLLRDCAQKPPPPGSSRYLVTFVLQPDAEPDEMPRRESDSGPDSDSVRQPEDPR